MKKIIITLTAVIMTISAFAQTSEIVKCRIWKPKSFCTLPDSVNVPGAVNYSDTYLVGVSCSKLDKKKNLVGIWVTFQGKNVNKLSLTSHYENITLVRKDTKEQLHPYAYMERSEPIRAVGGPQYNSKESTMERCDFKLEPYKRYDLFILFEAGEEGDKIIISNFLEAEITE